MVQNPQAQQEYTFVGRVAQIDNNKNYRPFRFSITDNTNQVQWFGTFDKPTASMIEQGGVNSGDWTVVYIMKPWTGTDGVQRYNYNVKSLSGSANQPTPQPIPQVQASEPVPQPPSSAMHDWASKLDPVGRSIIRQGALKNIENKDGKSPEQLNYLTDLYESIVLGTFVPEEDNPIIQDESGDNW